METYSLLELNEYIRRVIALNFEEAIWVNCEISQAKQSRRHFYIDLVEKDKHSDAILAQSNAVMWSSKHSQLFRKYGEVLHDVLQDGVEVRMQVKVDYHERYGLKLVIEDIDPTFTMGNIELRRREILEELNRQGLVELNKTVQTPLVPQRIAVLSAENAAGYHDFHATSSCQSVRLPFRCTLVCRGRPGTKCRDRGCGSSKGDNTCRRPL